MSRISTADMGEVEGVLTLVYELGEVVKIEPELSREGSPLLQILLAILAANPLGHPHPAVQVGVVMSCVVVCWVSLCACVCMFVFE